MKQVPDAVADDVLALRLLLASTDAVSVRPGWQVFIPEGPDGPTVLEERELLPVAEPGAGAPAMALTCVRRDGIDVTLSFGVRDGIQSSDWDPVAWRGTLRITLAGTAQPPLKLGVSDRALTGPVIAERWLRAAVLDTLQKVCKKHTRKMLREADWSDAGFFVWPLRKALGEHHGLRVHQVQHAETLAQPVQIWAERPATFPLPGQAGIVQLKLKCREALNGGAIEIEQDPDDAARNGLCCDRTDATSNSNHFVCDLKVRVREPGEYRVNLIGSLFPSGDKHRTRFKASLVLRADQDPGLDRWVELIVQDEWIEGLAPLDLEAFYKGWKAERRATLVKLAFWNPEEGCLHGAKAGLRVRADGRRELPFCVELQAHDPGHLVLWSQGTSGEIFQLLPHNHGASAPRVEAGRPLFFPDYEVHFPEWTEADGLNFSAPGTERLLALVSRDPLGSLRDLIEGDAGFCSVPPDHVEKLLRRARTIPGVQLGFAKITLE